MDNLNIKRKGLFIEAGTRIGGDYLTSETEFIQLRLIIFIY